MLAPWTNCVKDLLVQIKLLHVPDNQREDLVYPGTRAFREQLNHCYSNIMVTVQADVPYVTQFGHACLLCMRV